MSWPLTSSLQPPPHPRSAPPLPRTAAKDSEGPRVSWIGPSWGRSRALTRTLPRPSGWGAASRAAPQWAQLPWPGLLGPYTNPRPRHGLQPTQNPVGCPQTPVNDGCSQRGHPTQSVPVTVLDSCGFQASCGGGGG